MASIQDYYDILDISPNATLKEIKKAYMKKGREYANDKEKMILLSQAYEYFLNPEKITGTMEEQIAPELIEKINSIKEKSRNSKTVEERNKYLQEARQIYLEILNANPQNTEALWNLSTIEELLENYETSISYLRQLEQKVVRKDDKLEVYHRLGELYKKLGEIDEAIKCFYVIYKEDATYADDIKALVRLSYEDKKNIKVAIQVLNDCINRCSEIRLKILYLCETLRAIRMLKNASYQKVEDTLYKKLETFHTEDVQANDTNMAELVKYMQDAITRKDFEVFHRLEKIYESYHVKNNELNHTWKGIKQIVAIMEKEKFHKAIDLYFSEIWTKEIREQLGEWVIREAAEIKESLECIKREAPIYWKEWEEDLLDLEKAVNNNFNVSKEFRTLLKDRTMSYSLKKLVEYLLLDGFVKFEDIEDAFVKESDAFFEMEDKEKVQHNLRKMEEVYPICYAIFSDVFLKDTNTKKATNSNANPTSSTQQASQKSKTQLKENLKNPALLKNVLYRAIGWYVCLGISETLLNNEEGIWGIVGLLFGLVAYLFGAGAIYHFVEYYKPSKINEEQRIKLDKRKKWVKRLLKLGFAIWVVIFLIGTASEVITSIKQNIEFKKEEEYKAEHNYLLTDKELEKRDKLNKKYDALTEVMIRFKQIDDEVDVEETDYVEEADYILLEFTDYGYKGNIALTSNYLTNEEKELLWEAVQVVYNGEDTDYEKCEQFYELAYKIVKTKEESMVTVPNSNEVVIEERSFEDIIKELEATYGRFENKQSGVMYDSDDIWLEPNGILSSTILDFDADGSSELLVCHTESIRASEIKGIYYPSTPSYQIMMSMYELINGNIVLTDSIPFQALEDSSIVLSTSEWLETSLDLNVVNINNHYYFVGEEYRMGSAFGDGGTESYWMLTYIDNKFEYICVYEGAPDEDTGYTGHEFFNGKLLYSNLYYGSSSVYDKYGNRIDYDSLYDDFATAINAFFGKYNVKLKGNPSQYRSINRISFLSDNINKTEVFAFVNKCISADYRTNTYKFEATLHTSNNQVDNNWSFNNIIENITNNDSVIKISEEKALEIAREYWGIEVGSVDEDTGFLYSVQHRESENSEEYLVALRWLVDNNHWSTLDMVYIDTITGECRSYYE